MSRSLTAGPLFQPQHYLNTQRFSKRGIGIVVAAHLAALAILASLDVVPLLPPVSTLMVQIVAPAAPAQAEAAPPKPQPMERKPVVQRQPLPSPKQILAAPADAPGAVTEAAIVKETAPPAPAAPATLTQPRFDADYLSNPAPHYPPLSRRLGEEGKVVLRVHVEPGGRPSQIEIKSSSGSPRLDNAAQEAVSRWKFVPAKRGDEAVAAWVLVPIVFNLKN